LTDFLTYLYGVLGIDPEIMVTFTGSATDGDETQLIDGSQNWTNGQWAGFVCNDTTQGLTASVATNNAISLQFVTDLSAPVAPDDVYLLVPRYVGTSLAVATSVVNPTLAFVGADYFSQAVYCLAADRLLNYAPDSNGQTYWRDLRKSFNLMDVSLGVISGSSNESSSSQWLNPEQLRRLTLGDLQMLKTPPGREYLAMAQAYGEEIWGLS
jgi:hypothetical protein